MDWLWACDSVPGRSFIVLVPHLRPKGCWFLEGMQSSHLTSAEMCTSELYAISFIYWPTNSILAWVLHSFFCHYPEGVADPSISIRRKKPNSKVAIHLFCLDQPFLTKVPWNPELPPELARGYLGNRAVSYTDHQWNELLQYHCLVSFLDINICLISWFMK